MTATVGKGGMKKLNIIRTIDLLTMRAVALEALARQADDATAGLYAVKLAHHLEQAGREASELEHRLPVRPKRERSLSPCELSPDLASRALASRKEQEESGVH